MIKQISCIFLTIFFFAQTVNANLTKGEIDERISFYRSHYISLLKERGSYCEKWASNTIWGIDDAHKLFMSGNTIDAILKSIEVVEDTEYYLKKYRNCPYDYFTERNITALYTKYYVDTNRQESSAKRAIMHDQVLPDEQRFRVAKVYELAWQKINSICRSNPCPPNFGKILDSSKTIYQAVISNKYSVKSILGEIIAIRYFISLGAYSYNTKVFPDIRWLADLGLYTLRIVKNFAYNHELTFFEKYQLKALNYMVNELDPNSICPIYLTKFYSSVSHDQSEDKYDNILAMAYSFGHLFDAIYEHDYSISYSMDDCATKKTDIREFPFEFSREFKKEVRNLRILNEASGA